MSHRIYQQFRPEISGLISNNVGDQFTVRIYSTKNMVRCWSCGTREAAEITAAEFLKTNKRRYGATINRVFFDATGGAK